MLQKKQVNKLEELQNSTNKNTQPENESSSGGFTKTRSCSIQ